MRRRILLTILFLLGSLVLIRAVPLHARGPLSLNATKTVSGLRIVLAAPPGPHFLGELILVTVAFTNTAVGPLHYTGAPVPNGCTAAWLALTGGAAPFYDVPAPRPISCPGQPAELLTPGHGVTAQGLVPLTASGTVRLVARPVVVESRGASEQESVLNGPSLLLHVASTAPVTRTLLLTYHNSTVHVRVARGALPALLVQTVEDYTTGWGETGGWVPLKGATLVEPYSPSMGHPTTWAVLVGAPGYRVAVGVYTHAP